MVIPAGTKDPYHADDRWAGTFSPGWYYEPGLKGPLVPAAKNAEANAKLEHRSKVCSLVVMARFPHLAMTNSYYMPCKNNQISKEIFSPLSFLSFLSWPLLSTEVLNDGGFL